MERRDLATSPEECERLLRAMFEQAPIGIVLIGLDGRWLGVNQRLCDILGYSSQELTARSWGDHAPPDDLVDLVDLSSVRRLQAGDLDTYDVDKRCIRHDGAPVWVHVTASLVQAPEGKAAYVIAMVEDITDHRRLEHSRARLLGRAQAARAEAEMAREGSQRLEEILATAAHDLRTPLTATVGYIDLAERQTERLASMVRQACPDLSRQVEAARQREEEAVQSVERLSRLLGRLFDTAAIRTGKLEIHCVPCELVALVREQVEEIRVAAPERDIRLHEPADGGTVIVDADADRIGQVVMNYVTNALKYSAEDRPVDVFVEAHRGRARVAVRDEGSGIPKAEQARLWESFHRMPGSALHEGTPGGAKADSLGLGLHISKAIVAAHGGRVGVKSTVGEGSTFWFTLQLSHGPTQ